MVYYVFQHYVHLLVSWIYYLVMGIIFFIYLRFIDHYYQMKHRQMLNELVQAEKQIIMDI